MEIQDLLLDVIESLPKLSPESISLEDICPICLLSFATILSEQEKPPEGPDLSPPRLSFDGYLGITKLNQCGHVFCRRDLVEWIQNFHGSCPTCRHVFLNIKFPSDSDNESSDGGEYLPEDDDDEEDFFDGADDFDVEGMDLDFDSDIDHSFDGSEGTQEDTEEELWFTDETTWSEPELESGPEIQLEVLPVQGSSTSLNQEDRKTEEESE